MREGEEGGRDRGGGRGRRERVRVMEGERCIMHETWLC